MAGHSKWKNIKHKKAATDKLKAKKFAKLLKEITVCAKVSGGDINSNPTLRTLILKANEINMPKDNYLRAIKKGTGEIISNAYETSWYEGYGPFGIAVIVEVLSDNKNRAISEIRAAFNHNGGSIGEEGSVSWMFEKKGLINAISENFNEEELIELLSNFEIDDINIENNEFQIISSINSFNEIKNILLKNKFKIEESTIGYKAKNEINLDENQQETVLKFLENLEELDDTQNIYTNF